MKRKFFRIIAVTLIAVFYLGSAAMAAEICSSSYISYCSASVSATGGGNLRISFSVTGKSTMASIGATTIRIKDSDGNTVKTYSCASYPVMMGRNRGVYSGSVSYAGVSGTQYYAVVIFYAKNGSGSGSASYTTGRVTA